MRVEVVCKQICGLGEGPVWDASRQLICWLDIINGEIHEWSVDSKSLNTIPVYQMIGAMAICSDGNYIVALRNGLGFVDRQDGKTTLRADPEKHLPNNRFNDGKCDPVGRFWAGTMSLSEAPGAGNLYMLDSNGTVTKKIGDTTISNGLAWSLDRKTFYFIDTPTFRVSAHDYDMESGALSNRRTVIDIPQKEGAPDGMTIDDEGMLWIAHWGGWQVTRWNPFTGKKLTAIALPASRITSCTFGGRSFEDLYVTSAKVGLSNQELKQQPLAGSLFVIPNCGYKGLPAFQFSIGSKS